MKKLIIPLLTCLPLAAAACEIEGAARLSLDDDLVVFYRSDPGQPELMRHFSMLFWICRGEEIANIDSFKIDARMPAHNHGMNYRPEVAQTADGMLRAAGFLFHMPGQWQVEVSFRDRERRHRLSIEYSM